jgi:Fe-S cluster assembly protein SufD
MAERTVIRTGRVPVRETRQAKELALTLTQIEALGRGLGEPGWMVDLRREALQVYQSIRMPAGSDEAWRRTDLSELSLGDLELNALGRLAKVKRPRADLLKPLAGNEQGGQIVFGDEEPRVAALQPDLVQQGVVFEPLGAAARSHPEIVRRFLGQAVAPREGKFSALAAALGDAGVVAYVPPGVNVSLPLHSICWTSERGLRAWRVLIVVDEGGHLTYVHESSSPEGKQGALRTGLVEAIVLRDASLRLVEFQSWGRNIWNITHERAKVEQGASLDWIFGGTGSRLTKSFMTVDLLGQGSAGKMSGFYFADGIQHLDHDTQQNHMAPHTTSDLLFKGALLERSRSVWQGMIYVAHGAEKADGYQANRNLILSNEARADSIPGLEILADDVRCTHGATVGQLDPEEIFYLLSRGIPRPEAERVVVDGFFDPIMQRIPFDGVRKRLRETIDAKMTRVPAFSGDKTSN